MTCFATWFRFCPGSSSYSISCLSTHTYLVQHITLSSSWGSVTHFNKDECFFFHFVLISVSKILIICWNTASFFPFFISFSLSSHPHSLHTSEQRWHEGFVSQSAPIHCIWDAGKWHPKQQGKQVEEQMSSSCMFQSSHYRIARVPDHLVMGPQSSSYEVQFGPIRL